MIYQDILDEKALTDYARKINARAESVGARGRISVALLRDRILESGGKCEWCGVNLVGREFEIDHVNSLSKHGDNSPQNLVVSCQSCNRKKSDKHPARFGQEIVVASGQQTAFVAQLLAKHGIAAQTQPRLFDDDTP